MNIVGLSGRLVKDPVIRYNKDKAVGEFTLAVDRWAKGEKQTDFIRCICFGKTAERFDQYCTKGSPVIVIGEWRNNNWEKDGVKHCDHECVLSRVEFQSGKAVNARDIEGGEEFADVSDDVELPF